MTIAAVADHLWQSTLFAALIAAATLAFRSNRAAVRHALWLAASVKFLVPFAALVALGEQFGLRTAAQVAPMHVTLVVNSVSEPFMHLATQPGPPAAATGWDRLGASGLAIAAAIWLVGSLVVLGT